MDHLPRVARPYDPVLVPHLGGIYVGGGFSDLLRNGIVNLDNLQDESIPIADRKQAAPALQTLFFFGILHEVLGIDIVQGDFLTDDGASPLITTCELRRYLADWKTIIKELKADPLAQAQLTARNERVVKCFNESYDLWQAIPDFEALVGPKVQLSIHLLAVTLEHAVSSASGIPVGQLPWRMEPSEFLNARMRAQGWCPAVVSRTLPPPRQVWQYYCSLLGPPVIIHDEQSPCKPGHITCTLRPPQTTDAHYVAQHVCANSDCAQTTPQTMSDINAIVEGGGIPVLDYNPDTADLTVKKYEPGVEYTAISHVWADGLGNPTENRMPQCQLTRIHEAMQRIPWTNKSLVAEDLVWQTDRTLTERSPDPVANAQRPLLFWIDTICVPHEENLKRIAINNMRSVYSRANRVLVFDADLTGVEGTDLSAEEVLSRISLSKWLRRFWTLQEAVLAKIPWFQFKDEAYRSMMPEDPESETEDALYNDAVGYYCKDFNFDWSILAPHFKYQLRVAHVWDVLMHRSSTKEDDEPLCIATLLDMSPAQIDKLQDITDIPDRFVELWFQYQEIPTGVLFTVCPRLQKHPLHWAPKSITSLAPLPPPGASSAAIPTREGLHVTHHGLISTCHLQNNRRGVIAMQILPGLIYLIRQNIKQGNQPWNGVEGTEDLDFRKYTRVGVLLSAMPMESESAWQEQRTRSPPDRALGALVGITDLGTTTKGGMRGDEDEIGEEDTVIKATYLRAVSVLLKGSKWEKVGQRAWETWEEEEKSDTVPSRWTRARQRWLIS